MSLNYELGGILKALQESSKTSKTKKKKKRKVEKHEDSLNDTVENTDEDVVAVEEALIDLFTSKPEDEIEEIQEEDEEYKEYVNAADVIEKEEQKREGKDTEDSDENDKEVQKKKKVKDDPERLSRTLFVGNVSITVSRKMLKKLFMKFGGIETVRIRSVPRSDLKIPKKVAFIKKDFHSERNNMNAYVVFKTKEDADKAMACNGVLLEGLHLRVDKSDNNKHDHKNCLFVGNLPFNVAEEDLRQHFAGCGVVVDVRLIRDKATGIGKGFGYVRFKNSDGVTFGLKLNSSKFSGRSLRVYRSKEQPTTQQQIANRNRDKNNFGGLRVTSKKGLEKSKKMLGQIQSGKKSQNALRRIQGRQLKHKHSKNHERNVNRKVNRISKEKRTKK